MVVAGADNAVTDVSGIRVGHATRIGAGALTGTTTLLLPPGCVTSVQVRGGGPCTRETAALAPDHDSPEVDAIVLTGGSVYGLSAAHGVLTWLAEQGRTDRLPLVPAAGLFDLGRGGDFHARPDPELGRAAAAAATAGPVAQGNVGAGTGAVNAELKGGLGTASAVLPDGTVLAAIVAVNAAGGSVDQETGRPYGWRAALPGEFPQLAPGVTNRIAAENRPAEGGPHPLNTVIGVIATDARLTPAQTYELAGAAHDGLGLAVRPAHTMADGDTIFSVATGSRADPDVDALRAATVDVFTRAMLHGVFAAESVTTPWGELTAYRDRYPPVTTSPDPVG
ncbi:MAG TPA: P1 family peptidase [Pseudonocardiaceae bacterium]|jgi:putative pantetheine hydrolase|nr:P1 family peptidase [Pseudonocardiaceae bacterium]